MTHALLINLKMFPVSQHQYCFCLLGFPFVFTFDVLIGRTFPLVDQLTIRTLQDRSNF